MTKLPLCAQTLAIEVIQFVGYVVDKCQLGLHCAAATKSIVPAFRCFTW